MILESTRKTDGIGLYKWTVDEGKSISGPFTCSEEAGRWHFGKRKTCCSEVLKLELIRVRIGVKTPWKLASQ